MSITIKQFEALQEKVKIYNSLKHEAEEIECVQEDLQGVKNTKLEKITLRIDRLAFELDIPKGAYFEVVDSIVNALSIRRTDALEAMETIKEQISNILKTEG